MMDARQDEDEEIGYFPSNIDDNLLGTATGEDTPQDLRFSGLDPSMMMNQTHDPNLLVTMHSSKLKRASSAISANRAIPENVGYAPPPFEASPDHHPAHRQHHPASGGGIYKSKFDFSFLESFAIGERARLGLSTGPDGRRPVRQSSQQMETTEPTTIIPEESPVNVGSSRLAQRQFSQSTAQSRKAGGKLALFESTNTNPPPFDLPSGAPPHLMPSNNPGMPPAFSDQPITPVPGQPSTSADYSHRFAFYSNGLRSTIHARSLSELPAEGQTFEELFLGKKAAAALETVRESDEPTTQTSTPINHPVDHLVGKKDPTDRFPDMAAWKDEEDANSWWMDILSPTGE